VNGVEESRGYHGLNAYEFLKERESSDLGPGQYVFSPRFSHCVTESYVWDTYLETGNTIGKIVCDSSE
jgi:hypothetical protein